MNAAGMKYPVTLIIAALVCSTAAAAPEPVTCDSPCDCHDAYGEGRWSVKTDASLPPTDASAIQAVTPSEMFSWPGPDAPITMQSERTGIENKWYALKGRVVELKVEEDGDVHVALHAAQRNCMASGMSTAIRKIEPVNEAQSAKIHDDPYRREIPWGTAIKAIGCTKVPSAPYARHKPCAQK